MKIKLFDIVLLAMTGALMFVSKLLMEFLPNIHLIDTFIVALTVVYRGYALLPIYLFVFLTGFLGGFAPWWYAYLYIWTVLWGIVMLIPRKMPSKIAEPVYAATAALHGLLFGTLYAPAQALLFGFNFKQTVAWIIAGLPFDIAHAVGNLCAGLLIVPIIKVLQKAYKMAKR